MLLHRTYYKLLYIIIFITLVSKGFAETLSQNGLNFSNFWIKEVVANNKSTSGYFTIENTNDEDEHLIFMSSNFSEKTELHNMIVENDIMKMKHLSEGVIIKAKTKLILKPGGHHLMFIKLNEGLQLKKKYDVHFRFKSGKTIVLSMPVKNQASNYKEKIHHHHH